MEEPSQRGHLKLFALHSSPLIRFFKQVLENSSPSENADQSDLVSPNHTMTPEVFPVQVSDPFQQVRRPLFPGDDNSQSQVKSLLRANESAEFEHGTPSYPGWVSSLIDRIRQAETIETLLEMTVTEVSQPLQLDRVLIYQFHTETQGTVLAESMVEGYTPMLGESLPAIAVGLDQPLNNQHLPFVAIHHIAEKSLTPYQAQILERFQVKASLTLPIWIEEQLWGLFAVQQCDSPRRWEDAEIALLSAIVTELRLKLQPLGFRSEQQVLARVSHKIRETVDLDVIFQTITREVRKFLGVERVAVCEFQPDDSARYVAESKAGEWPPMIGNRWQDLSLLERDHHGNNQPFVMDDVTKADLSDRHLNMLENFEIQAGAIVPIFEGQNLWGGLCAYQHSHPHCWTEHDISFLTQISNQLGIAIQRAELMAEKLKAETYKQELPAILSKMSSTSYIQNICQTVVEEVRRLLNVERICVYRFRPDYFGDFIYESELAGYPSLVGSAWEDTYVQQHQGGRLRRQEPFVADDIYTAGLSDCHVAALEHFGIKAFIVVGIKQGEKLWGLLSAFQHSSSRHWLEAEINLLNDMGCQLGAALQGADYLLRLQEQANQMTRAARLSQMVTESTPKILQSQDMDTLLRVTTQSVRQLLKCDRVAIYCFKPDWRSTLIADSAKKTLDGADKFDLEPLWPQTNLQTAQGGPYRDHERLVVNNIYVAGHSLDEIERLEEFDISAYVIVPIFKANQLWGLLGAYQNSQPRSWTEAEVNAVNQIAIQMSVTMQQVDYLQQLQQTSAQLAKTAEREYLVAKIVERIRQSIDLQKTLKTTAKEIRNFLKVDRVAVFKFYPESGCNEGETVAEDVQPGYTSALGIKVDDHCFGERHAELYRKGRVWAVADLYQANLRDCYLEILSQFQVQANLVVPLRKGEELWGLFCIHQCSGPREWQEAEIEFARQIAAQLNVAIQQGEYVEQLQQQAEQKERLQKDVMQLLIAVRPALEGDLTVRAPVTDNEVGTIADAYNNMP